jgi:hypothetical protein
MKRTRHTFRLGELVTATIPDRKNYPYVFRVEGFSRDGKFAVLSNFTSGSANRKPYAFEHLNPCDFATAEKFLRLHAQNVAEKKFPQGGPAIALAKKFDLSKRLQELRGLKLTTDSARKAQPEPRRTRQPRTVQSTVTELDQLVNRLIWTHGLTAFESAVESFKQSVSSLLEA